MKPSFAQALGFVVLFTGVWLYRMGIKYDRRHGRKK